MEFCNCLDIFMEGNPNDCRLARDIFDNCMELFDAEINAHEKTHGTWIWIWTEKVGHNNDEFGYGAPCDIEVGATRRWWITV